MTSELLFRKGLEELGITCSKEQITSFMIFLSELKKWSRAYNLTALRSDNDIIIKHFLDSILYLKAVPEGRIKLADAGSGAGFPGIPIKIIRPDIDVALIESSRKKASFLRHIIRTLALPSVTVLEQRLEMLGKDHERSFDVMVSRATFRIQEFLDLACPFVKENGVLIVSKGPGLKVELEESKNTLAPHAIRHIYDLTLPVISARRNLVVLEC